MTDETDDDGNYVPEPAPVGLGDAGRELWEQVASVYEVDAHERPLLAEACRLADRCAQLEESIEEHGLTVEGSTGQPRLHPAVAEVRQTRVALTRVLGAIAFPNEEGVPVKAGSRHASKAAVARWKGTAKRGA